MRAGRQETLSLVASGAQIACLLLIRAERPSSERHMPAVLYNAVASGSLNICLDAVWRSVMGRDGFCVTSGI